MYPNAQGEKHRYQRWTRDSKEAVRAWYAQRYPHWKLVDYSGAFPAQWRLLEPNTNRGVIIIFSEPNVTIQIKCSGSVTP